jgi:ribosomal protein L4
MSDELNCYDLINADTVVFEEAAINEVEEALK